MKYRLPFLFLTIILVFSLVAPSLGFAAEENTYIGSISQPEDASGYVSTLDISSDNQYLASGHSSSKFVYIWTMKNRQLFKKINITGSSGIEKVVFSPDGTILATINKNYTNDAPDQKSIISLWDVQTGVLILQLKGHSGKVNDISFSPDGHTLASVSDDNRLKLWDTLSGEVKRTIDVPGATAVAFHPTNGQIAVAADPYNQDITIHILDYMTGDHLQSLPINSFSDITRLEYSKDGRRLALSIHNLYTKTPLIFNVAEEYKLQDQLEFADANSINELLFTNNSQFVAHFNWSYLEVYNIRSGELIYDTYLGSIYDVAISPDDKVIATTNSSSISLYDSSILANVKIIESIEINNNKDMEVYDKSKTNLIVKAHYKDGKTEVIDSGIEWKTSNYSIAIVDENNQLSSRREGEVTLTATYQGFSDTVNVKVNEGFTSWDAAFDEPVNKSWDVEFSLPIDISTIIEKNIYVTNHKNEIVPVLYAIDRTKESSKVTVFPAKDYNPGETYTLWIKNIKSEKGEVQKEFVKKEFTIMN